MKVLEMNNVNKTFYTELGEINVIKNLNLTINDGEIIAVVGPSGSGKSTILNMISGLIKPTSGNIVVSGELGYMFQHDQLFEWRTVWKNVLLGLEIKHQINDETKQYVSEMLKKYDLDDFKNNYPKELSGGMRQRIALIRTMATKPNILLLDEPFSALDYQTRIKVSDDIYKIIRDQHLTAILVTHDISEAISMADKVVVLSKRPATIKSIYDINVTIDDELIPMNKRKANEFRFYFDEIWRDLNE